MSAFLENYLDVSYAWKAAAKGVEPLVWLFFDVLYLARSDLRRKWGSATARLDQAINLSTCDMNNEPFKDGRRVIQHWGSPILAMAPMVGQSDYPFRLLCRHYSTTIC